MTSLTTNDSVTITILPFCYFTGSCEVCVRDDGLVGDLGLRQPRHDRHARLATTHRPMATDRGQYLRLNGVENSL